MKLYFNDQTFSFELLRAVSYAPYGGAEIGECLATAARIRAGDFDVPARLNPGLRWASANGMWVFGARTRRELLAAIHRYSLKQVAARITCPTLILHGERDHFIPAQQVAAFYEALNCPKTLHVFNADDGAEEHCQIGNLSRMHQVAFDWLDQVFKVVEQSGRLAIDTPLTYVPKGLEAVHI